MLERPLGTAEIAAFLGRFRAAMDPGEGELGRVAGFLASVRGSLDHSASLKSAASAQPRTGDNSARVAAPPRETSVRDATVGSRMASDLTTSGIKSFFDALRALRKPEPTPRMAPGSSDIQAFLGHFADVMVNLREQQAEVAPGLNIFRAMAIGRNEIKSCRILAWLLDAGVSHGQGARFLRCLLRQQPQGEKGRCPETLADERYAVRREVQLDASSRVDITVTGQTIRLLLEVKIDAVQGDTQLERYWKESERAHDLKIFGLYLTRSEDEPPPGQHGFRPISWEMVARALRCFSGQTEEQDARLVARNKFVQLLASQYADFILAWWMDGRVIKVRGP